MEYSKLLQTNIAPKEATHVAIFKDDIEIASIPLEGALKNDYNKKANYKFGILSDVHHDNSYDKYYYQDRIKDSVNNQQAAHDLNNALKFFEDNEQIKFTCISGDLTVQQGEVGSPFIFNTFPDEDSTNSHLADLDSFKYNVEHISPSTPVFIAKGNHDCGALDNVTVEECINRNVETQEELWVYYTNIDKYNDYNIHFYDETDKKTFYFEYQGDLFIFLSLKTNNFWDSNTRPISPYNRMEIEWVDNILSENIEKRSFIFTHLMFDHNKGYAGNYNNNYGNMTLCYENEDFLFLQGMTEKYPKSIWFSGHTHWRWDSQEKDKTANVTNVGGSWQVHIPSCAYPRIVSDNGEWIVENKRSEGGVVEVYDNYVIVKGVIFKDDNSESNYINKYLPIATYKIPVSKG